MVTSRQLTRSSTVFSNSSIGLSNFILDNLTTYPSNVLKKINETSLKYTNFSNYLAAIAISMLLDELEPRSNNIKQVTKDLTEAIEEITDLDLALTTVANLLKKVNTLAAALISQNEDDIDKALINLFEIESS